MGRTIDDVADQLKLNKENRASCVLLIGAGCSVEAGIPLASGFVRRIKEKFPRKYDLASEKTYPGCMRELASSERHELISTAIDEAKINLAHIAIARMMKSGHVDRVLTTNFDPLVMRACALFNIFPAIYDMTTAGKRFRPSLVRDRAVFHLHGQRDGFFQAHTPDDVEALEQSFDPLFRDCADRRTWLVVGYSGANDPVFRQLERMPDFGHDLYWVPFKGEPMPPHLEPLMQPGRGGYWLDGDWDADNFLVQLAGRIECPDPPFLTHPFIHLREGLEQIGSWTLPGESSRLPIVDIAFRKIDKAIGCIEERSRRCPLDETASEPAEDLEGLTRSWLMAGRYDEIIAREADIRIAQAPAALDSLAWAYQMAGKIAIDQFAATSGPESEDLFRQALEHYQRAIEIKSDDPLALNNLGIALSHLGQRMATHKAEELFRQAIQLHKRAIEISPDDPNSFHNMGNALLHLGQRMADTEAEDLFRQAEEKFTRANKIKIGRGSYNLACIAALRGREDECQQWLKDSQTHGTLPNRAHLESDLDLDSVRDTDWFKGLLNSLPGGD